jgi:hypothetical protein
MLSRREIMARYRTALFLIFLGPLSAWLMYDAAMRSNPGAPMPESGRGRGRLVVKALTYLGMQLGPTGSIVVGSLIGIFGLFLFVKAYQTRRSLL